MKYGIVLLAISLVVAGGIVMQTTEDQESSSQDNETQEEPSPMKEKYTTIQSPKNDTEIGSSTVPIRFDLSENYESYELFIDGESRKSGEVNETNIINTDVEEGSHTYYLEIYNESEDRVDTTRERSFTYRPASNITDMSPNQSIESGEEVEFRYYVETDDETDVELFVNDEKAAEDIVNSDQEISTTVENIPEGNQTWRVETDHTEEEETFEVEESLPPLEIKDYSVQDSDDGWNARTDVEAEIETEYELILNGEVETTGTVEPGSESLGLPIDPESGENTAKIRFENEEGEFETREETFNAD